MRTLSDIQILGWGLACAALLTVLSCATQKGGDKLKDEDGSSAKNSKNSDDDSNIEVSKTFRANVFTMSNDPILGFSVDKSDAESLVKGLEASVKSEPKQLESHVALMAAKRLAGQSYKSVAASGSRLAEEVMKKNIDRGIPVIARMELALAAVKNRDYSMAEHWLPSLLESKDSGIKAAGLTIQGIIEFNDGREPEAVNSWLLARKEQDKYTAATLNLAMASLRFGSYRFADAMLKELPDEWITILARATAERMSGNAKGAQALCDKAVDKASNRLTLFNCAVVEWQSANELGKALKMLSDAESKRGGGSALEKKISKLASDIKKDGAAQKREEKAEKREEKASKANDNAKDGGKDKDGSKPKK